MAATGRVCGCLLAKVKLSVNPLRSYSIRPPEWMGSGTPLRSATLQELPTFREKRAARKKDAAPESVNIGEDFQPHVANRRERIQQAKTNHSNRELEREARHQKLKIPLDDTKLSWHVENGPSHMKRIATHYGIYDHLFEGAHFYPVKNVNICYDYDDEYVTPVYLGNKISSEEATSAPHVSYEADDGSYWTLLLTNPDGHLLDNDKEYLHWMIGNIPSDDIGSGDVLCDYLRPFPPRGSGFHRHVFILFKQDAKIDFTADKLTPNSASLKERTFKTLDFYRKYEDHLTPVGLNFFQAEYDPSVRAVYHDVLRMREPEFEYQHPPPYHPPQKMYPLKQPFDRYFDRYRDKKDLAEEVLKLKLSMISPYEPHPERSPYPLVHREKSYMPSWLKKRNELMHRRLEQFKDLP